MSMMVGLGGGVAANESEREAGKCGREMVALDVRRRERCMKWP